MIRLKRVYEEYSADDGYRILVDRLWPRGVSKESAHLDLWMKDVAPSTELRKWFSHDPAKWAEFEKRYTVELETNPAVGELRNLVKTKKTITLLYGARNIEHNEAVVIRRYFGEK